MIRCVVEALAVYGIVRITTSPLLEGVKPPTDVLYGHNSLCSGGGTLLVICLC